MVLSKGPRPAPEPWTSAHRWVRCDSRGVGRGRVESQFCHAKLIPSGNTLRSNTSPCRVRGAVAPPFEHLTRRIIQVAQRLGHTWGEPILLFSHCSQSFSCWGTVQSSWLSFLPHRGSAASTSNDHSTTKTATATYTQHKKQPMTHRYTHTHTHTHTTTQQQH